jgi:ABC-type transport system involved in multi-copper enzyme maturation permease subunit
MIATIKSEWRKNLFRPAFLVGSGLIAGITVLIYSGNWYLATHPSGSERVVSLASLYPAHFVDNVLGAGFPLGAAMAIVLGAIFAGSEYSWGTLKTMLTQGPGRVTTWGGRVVVFVAWMGIMTVVLFVVGGAYSAVIALFQNQTISWPELETIAKGFGAIWLVFAVNGAIGMALGVVIRQSAAALGIGLVYLLAVEIIAVRFIDSLSNGAYKWIGDLFMGQNANALLASITPPPVAPSIGAEQALFVLAAYFVVLLVIAGGLVRLRDVT